MVVRNKNVAIAARVAVKKALKGNVTFVDAYEKWKGQKWEWGDGVENHPNESDDPEIVAFYQGFMAAKSAFAPKFKELSAQVIKAVEDAAKARAAVDKFIEEF